MTDKKTTIISCPQCRTQTVWEGNPHRPFCSERCRMIDLGAWAKGEYRISGGDTSFSDGDDETEPVPD